MPVAYQLPPWIGQPADPAAHYGQGFQIGMRLGAEQAANQYRQQQLLMEQQKMAFEQQYAQQKQALEIGEIVQKQRAAAVYQGMVSQGVNPMQALAVTGLSMGMDPDRMAAIQANQEYRQAQLEANKQRWTTQASIQRAQEMRRGTQAEKSLAERQREFDLEQARKSKQEKVTPTIQVIEGQSYLVNPKTGHYERLDKTITKPDFISRNVTRWMSESGLDREQAATEMGDFYDKHIAPVADKKPSAPNSTPLPEVQTGRIRMRSPDGKTGTLPANQVDAAMAQGWTRL